MPIRKRTSARSRSENSGPSLRCRARSSSSRASRTCLSRIRTVASPESVRTSSSGSPVASTADRRVSNSAIASGFRRASSSAWAREIAASTRPRSSAETPLARKPASTPRRTESQSIVSLVGRVFPRSIWLTYSFENRSPASSVWVIPAATRSCRSRSPSRRPACAAVARCLVAVGCCICGVMLRTKRHASQNRKLPEGASPKKGMFPGFPGQPA